MKLFTCGTTALFAAALTLQAQTSGAGTSGSAAGSAATSNVGTSSQAMPSSSSQSGSQFGSSSTTPSTGTSATAQSNGSQFGTTTSTSSSNTQFGTAPANPSTPTGANSGFSTSTPSTYGSQSFNAAANANTSTSANMNSAAATTQSTYAGGGFTTVNDAQVTSFVQQFDSVGPDVVVQRASSDLGDLACSQDTVQSLVQALHSGRSVTITSNVNGQPQSATFNPQGVHMGYGEAYLTLAMAAQELRNAGVSTCATPEQWNAVLMGGPLNVTSTSTTVNSSASASGSRQVQGIVTLRQQGQGWGQIAQANNVQLGQVINSGTSQTGAQSGFSNPQAEQGNVNASGTTDDNGNHKSHKHHWWNRNKDKDNNQDSSSTHADSSAKPDNK